MCDAYKITTRICHATIVTETGRERGGERTRTGRAEAARGEACQRRASYVRFATRPKSKLVSLAIKKGHRKTLDAGPDCRATDALVRRPHGENNPRQGWSFRGRRR